MIREPPIKVVNGWWLKRAPADHRVYYELTARSDEQGHQIAYHRFDSHREAMRYAEENLAPTE
jgi:hypothetical protein